MNRLNEWLTLAANIGVIAGLVFLGLEIQQNTTQLRANTSYSINDALAKINAPRYLDADFADIWVRGLESLDNLDEVEKVRFESYAYDLVNLAVYVDKLEKQDLSDVHLDVVDLISRRIQDNPGLRAVLTSMKRNWAASEELYTRLTDDR